LPVSQRREEIRDAIAAHPVVIICGDTGSGKTTQLPKIALEVRGPKDTRRIGCTQPRRIAATSVARRVADEMQVNLGAEVGYQIRFEDRTSKETAIKFMTDGILLAETRNDPSLRQYDTLIIDEAHERSLNIDFILGYLKRTLAKRRDLKVVISSATLDAGAFSEFFGGAPVVQVEGRTFPVEDRYLPWLDDREPLAEHIGRAVEELASEDRLGDTLVFLPGEREIRNAADLLDGRRYSDTMIIPLFARQAANEQQAVFSPVRGKRRVILATNVAETSLTIPGIRFVVDTGIARVSRYDPGSGIQRLQIEEISQASARQRRGRCGRVSEGVCVRLYDEENFEDRPEYTDPEILRSNLAGVVLQMEHLGLGDPLKFPFLDPPQPKRVAQAYRVLEEISAVQKRGKQIELTGMGHELARMPLDPRVGRILIAAREENCLAEGLIIASALTVQDPRERPQEKQQIADEAHAGFRDKRSDFTGWLNWWFAVQNARSKSSNELRRFCRKNFLNYRRTQEWLNLHRELRDTLRQMKWQLPPAKKGITDPAETYSESLHRAILAAIPSQIGLNQGKKLGYKGARNTKFFLFPGSGIFSSQPAWVMAFEMVETAKLYARNAAMFDPGWFEKVAPHLCRYSYTNPHWVAEQGAVYGEESVIAFGLPVIEKRRVHYGRIDRKLAREVFILEALVNGNTRAPMPALKSNRETVAAAERLEHKMRRYGGLVHPDAVVAFYEDRVPGTICTQKDFEKWASEHTEGALDFSLEDCILPQREPIAVDDFPDTLPSADGESEFAASYLHNPSEVADGITATIPLGELSYLPEWFGDWLVPGWLPEKVSAALRCLSKATRTLLPANREVVDDFVDAWDGYVPACGLVEALCDFFSENYGVEISDGSFDLDRIPAHLQMRFRIVDDAGKILGEGEELTALQSRLAGKVRDRFATVAKGKYDRERIGSWSFGELPDEVPLDRHTVGYPRLHNVGGSLPSMKMWADRKCADFHHRMGVAKLYRVVEKDRANRLSSQIVSPDKSLAARPKPSPTKKQQKSDFGSLAVAFGGAPVSKPVPRESVPKSSSAAAVFLSTGQVFLLSQLGPDPARNREDLIQRIVSESLGGPLTEGDWKTAKEVTDRDLFENAARICATVARILDVAGRIGGLLASDEPGYEESVADAREHLASLLASGWLMDGSLRERLSHFQGLETRVTRMFGAPAIKDLQKLERYQTEAAEVWRAESGCECRSCPRAIANADVFAADFGLRLKIFAPEIRARMK